MPLLRTTLAFTVIAAFLLAACGGGGGPGGGRPNLRDIPTATPYSTLPPPTIVTGEGLGADTTVPANTYVVQSGDTASDIADRLGVTLDELAEANGTTIEELRFLQVGQVLKIPGRAVAGATPEPTPGARATPSTQGEMQTYTVESGDNASDIATRFGITLEELAAANDTTIEGLRDLEVGQVLSIPPPSSAPEPEPTEEPTQEPAPEVPTETPTPEG